MKNESKIAQIIKALDADLFDIALFLFIVIGIIGVVVPAVIEAWKK